MEFYFGVIPQKSSENRVGSQVCRVFGLSPVSGWVRLSFGKHVFLGTAFSVAVGEKTQY